MLRDLRTLDPRFSFTSTVFLSACLGGAADRMQNRVSKLIIGCLVLVMANLLPLSAARSDQLQPVYQIDLSNGSAPSLDLLGVGALQPGFTLAATNPIFTPSSDGTTIALTRPADPTLVGPVGAGLFATPVSFGQGSTFALQATFIAPTGPHNVGDVWAAAVGARTGDQDDLGAETRAAATFQVRAGGARLNVVGATAPANQLNIDQAIYDSIFDSTNPQPFTLYLLLNRETGGGKAMLTVGSFVTSVDFLLADFRSNLGPPITAVGPSIAISNAPGQTASITVRNFSILSAVPEPSTWVMMLLGFGAIGLSVRRNKTGTGSNRLMSAMCRKQTLKSGKGRSEIGQ